MTKSITVVNTSNWDGEDVELELTQGGTPTPSRLHNLQPGEKVQISLEGGNKDILVRSNSKEETKPFVLSGKQVYPQVSVGFNGDEGYQ